MHLVRTCIVSFDSITFLRLRKYMPQVHKVSTSTLGLLGPDLVSPRICGHEAPSVISLVRCLCTLF